MTAPIFLPLYLIGSIIYTLFYKRSVAFLFITFSFLVYNRFLFQHAFRPVLLSTLLHHPILVFAYCVFAYLVLFCVISSRLSKLKKKDIQVIYTLLRLACVVFIGSATASITVALVIGVLLVLLGLLTHRLKLTNLYVTLWYLMNRAKEWRYLQQYVRATTPKIHLETDEVENVRQQLVSLKCTLKAVGFPPSCHVEPTTSHQGGFCVFPRMLPFLIFRYTPACSVDCPLSCSHRPPSSTTSQIYSRPHTRQLQHNLF